MAGIAITGMMGMLNGCLYADLNLGWTATDHPVGSKMGQACAMAILGLVAWGDASVVTAAKNGGISKVATVDKKLFNILGVYSTHCTVVSGE